MAYPTQSAQIALEQIDQEMIGIRSRASSELAAMAAGDVTSQAVLNLYTDVKFANDRLNDLKTAPGIAAYAKDAKGDQSLDVVAEFNAVQAQLAAVNSQIESDFPALGGGWLSHVKFDTGAIVFNTFTPAQTANLRTELQALIDLITL